MSKKWSVTLPIAGYCYIEVEAADKEGAIRETMAACDMSHIESWEAYRRLTSGNVLFAEVNEADATEIPDDEL